MAGSITHISQEPKVAKNAVDIVSRVNPKYHFPGTMKLLERQLRTSLGLPFTGKLSGTTAYGYTYQEDIDTYIPDPAIFKLIWEARRYLYTSSLREVADWLNFKAKKLGYTQQISHQGVRNIMILRPPFEECLLPIEEKEKLIEAICLMNKSRQ